MKIIKAGKVKELSAKKTCGYCKTQMEYTNSDITSDRDGSYIKCPTCEKFLSVDYLTPKF